MITLGRIFRKCINLPDFVYLNLEDFCDKLASKYLKSDSLKDELAF